MFCTNEILTLSSGIYQNLGSPTNISVGYISGFLTASGSLGDLNNRLTVRFGWSGDAPCITSFDTGQGLDSDEQSIYALIFKDSFYRQQALLALTNLGWTRIQEADSSISREGTVAQSKAYLLMADQNQKLLALAVASYKRGVSIPAQVVADSLPSFPSP